MEMADHHQRHQSPIVSLLCPPPINVVVCSNTFVKFRHGAQEVVGLVLQVDAVREMVSMRLFLTWEAVKERIALIGNVNNISLWPKDGRYPPFYICDTDLVVDDIPTSSIVGLAFVFYDTSPNIRVVNGMVCTKSYHSWHNFLILSYRAFPQRCYVFFPFNDFYTAS
jgi:hypothetical protein